VKICIICGQFWFFENGSDISKSSPQITQIERRFASGFIAVAVVISLANL
jgi:hypothetical protein